MIFRFELAIGDATDESGFAIGANYVAGSAKDAGIQRGQSPFHANLKRGGERKRRRGETFCEKGEYWVGVGVGDRKPDGGEWIRAISPVHYGSNLSEIDAFSLAKSV